MLPTSATRHELHVNEAEPAHTRATCSCGAWAHEATTDTVRVTGKSREEALRAAHELHARDISIL